MKVGVLVPGPVPYVFGGAERAAAGLVRWIDECTEHQADLVMPPSPERDLGEVVTSYGEWSQLDVGGFDLVVSTKYPAWMVDHPHHVVFMFHPLRGLYDTYPGDHVFPRLRGGDRDLDALRAALGRPPERELVPEVLARFAQLRATRDPADPLFAFPGPLAREIVHFLDRVGLDPRHVRRHFALSATVAVKRGYFPPGTDVRVLIPPSSLEGMHGGAFDYFFTASRLDGPKRLDLLVRAMAHVPEDVRLRIAGSGPEEGRLRALAAGDDRVELLGSVSDTELADLYADALAVPFVPRDEDLGLITLEAGMSGKAVITCRDSGGPTELVADGANGFVTEPDPAALGRALSRLASDRELARELGAEGERRARRVTWERVGRPIVAARDHPLPVARRASRAKLVVTSTFPVHPPVGGGQLRCHHLYGALTSELDVEIVSLAPMDHAASRVVHAPGFVETIVPKTADHDAAEARVERLVGMPVTDIVAGALVTRTPAYVDALRHALDGASAVLLAHPYLGSLVHDVRPDLPMVYDAHNAELALKDSVLPRDRAGDGLREIVRSIEGRAVQRARLVAGCSLEDHAVLESEFGPHPFVYVANGVDTDAIAFVDEARRARAGEVWRSSLAGLSPELAAVSHTALFVGSWHPPNLDAVEHVVDFARELPHVGFVVAGSVCLEFRGRRLPDNVMLLGVVSDSVKRALLESADVALNPMVRGSGTNLKMVEYLAAGIPTVSTKVAARGLDIDDEREVLVRDVDGFVDAIVELLGDADRRAVLARNGRALVVERYDWKVLGTTMLRALADTVPELGLRRDPNASVLAPASS